MTKSLEVRRMLLVSGMGVRGKWLRVVAFLTLFMNRVVSENSQAMLEI